MKKRSLGATDLQVTPICLGTMQFGWLIDEEQSHAVLDAYVGAGGNFLDTADLYSRWHPGNPGGVSEEMIGRWLKAHGGRDRLVIGTKVRGRMWKGPDGEGLSRAHIMRAAEDSLRRLQIETIDLYLCHWPDENTPIDETLRAFDELIRSGKVRYIGVSNHTAPELENALRVAEERRLPRFFILQPHYNLVHRAEYEQELAALCQREGLGVTPYAALAKGFLTGKYRPGKPLPESRRAGSAGKYMNARGLRVLEALERVAVAHETTVTGVALAWLLARPAVAAAIVGANSRQQVTDLLPAADLSLTGDDIAALDAASEGF